MKVTIVVSANLLDSSRIKEVAKTLPNEVLTCSNLTRVTRMLSAGPGDRNFTVVLDYYVYEKTGFESIRTEIDNLALSNDVNKVKYMSFVPHEKIDELASVYPDVNFIARSAFFRNPAKYLS